jgi:hypothetical protein
LQNNIPYFEKRAAEGNVEMKELLEEIKERGLVDDNPVKGKVVEKE